MNWWKNFFASFRKQKEAEPEKVRAHFEQLRQAPPQRRKDLARTMRPEEITQMLAHTLEHVGNQTDATLNGNVSIEDLAAFEKASKN